LNLSLPFACFNKVPIFSGSAGALLGFYALIGFLYCSAWTASGRPDRLLDHGTGK
jgi:hypothetical protein